MKNTTGILNHLSFPSDNIEDVSLFFEKYLGCTIEYKMKDAWILKHGNVDIVIESESTKGNPTHWPKNFHFGLEFKTVDEVKALYEVFQKDGVKLETEVFNNQRGSRFFVRTGCGMLVEINTREDMNAELLRNNK